MVTEYNKEIDRTLPIGGICPSGYTLSGDGYCYRTATRYNETRPGLSIMCDNESIYCDSEDYYCDGSVVMRDIQPGRNLRCNNLEIMCNESEIDCLGSELHRKVAY